MPVRASSQAEESGTQTSGTSPEPIRCTATWVEADSTWASRHPSGSLAVSRSRASVPSSVATRTRSGAAHASEPEEPWAAALAAERFDHHA